MKATRQYSFSNLPELHGLCPPQLHFLIKPLIIKIKNLKNLPCVCKLYRAPLMLYRVVRHYNDTTIAWLERMCVCPLWSPTIKAKPKRYQSPLKLLSNILFEVLNHKWPKSQPTTRTSKNGFFFFGGEGGKGLVLKNHPSIFLKRITR